MNNPKKIEIKNRNLFENKFDAGKGNNMVKKYKLKKFNFNFFF